MRFYSFLFIETQVHDGDPSSGERLLLRQLRRTLSPRERLWCKPHGFADRTLFRRQNVLHWVLFGRAVSRSKDQPRADHWSFHSSDVWKWTKTNPRKCSRQIRYSARGSVRSPIEDFPFKSLKDFNSDFLDRFEVVQMPNERLHSVTFIDTPGILSGEEKNARGYDLCLTIKEFASRCDRIFVLFDASKLDISTEMKTILQSLKVFTTSRSLFAL